MSNQIKSVGIIGSGNVAWNLASGFQRAGINVSGVYSRNQAHAEKLAAFCNSKTLLSLAEFSNENNDLLLIAVSDNSIETVSQKLEVDIPVVHTSGTYDRSQNKYLNGVFYPLQTFTKDRLIELEEVPFLVEADEIHLQDALLQLARKLSTNVKLSDHEERSKLHLSAVWINNFVNHMIYKSFVLCKEQQVDFKLLIPLLKETVEKAIRIGPFEAQTGPARRNDSHTLSKHLSMLSAEDRDLYLALSNSIIKTFMNEKL